MSLVVEAGGDGEDVGHALVRRDDGSQAFQLLVVSEVPDPVGAAGRRRRDEPLHRHVAALVRAPQPVEPAAAHTAQSAGSKVKGPAHGAAASLPGLP